MKTKNVHGVVFHQAKIRPLDYIWQSVDGRATVQSNGMKATYSAFCDGRLLGKLYRNLDAALRAAADAVSAA